MVLQNINAYFLLIDKDFVVCDTNYYSLNRLPVQVGGVTKRVGDLLHCRNAIAAGECGQHEQCKLCCIRASIGKAFYKKASFKNLEASMKLLSEDEATVTPDVYKRQASYGVDVWSDGGGNGLERIF